MYPGSYNEVTQFSIPLMNSLNIAEQCSSIMVCVTCRWWIIVILIILSSLSFVIGDKILNCDPYHYQWSNGYHLSYNYGKLTHNFRIDEQKYSSQEIHLNHLLARNYFIVFNLLYANQLSTFAKNTFVVWWSLHFYWLNIFTFAIGWTWSLESCCLPESNNNITIFAFLLADKIVFYNFISIFWQLTKCKVEKVFMKYLQKKDDFLQQTCL